MVPNSNLGLYIRIRGKLILLSLCVYVGGMLIWYRWIVAVRSGGEAGMHPTKKDIRPSPTSFV